MPLTASPLEKVGDGRYLLSVQWDMAFSKAYRLKGKQKEELLQAKREERDYQVLDELPFYFNGKGYVNKKRAALFLYEEATGALTRVTPEAFDTASAHLSPDGKKLLYTGEKFVSKRREKSGVWVYDLLTGKTEELLPAREYELYDALWWGEKILLLATAQKRYGLNENAQFYTLDPQTREVALLCPLRGRPGLLGGQRLPLRRRGRLDRSQREAVLYRHHPQRLPPVRPGPGRDHLPGVHGRGIGGLPLPVGGHPLLRGDAAA